MTSDLANKLRGLLLESSKHAAYQELSSALSSQLGQLHVPTKSRHERERLKYILNHVDFSGVSVLDVGANTGFFAFELLSAGASRITAYEGNTVHAEFIRLAANFLHVEDRVTVVPAYFDVSHQVPVADVALLLNVLHHLGDDFGEATSSSHAIALISRQFARFADISKTLVFQLGYNWKGDRNFPLFSLGTKSEQIAFVEEAATDSWQIEYIGIAERSGAVIQYNELSADNVHRDDSLGEFLNRPIFILKSKRIQSR